MRQRLIPLLIALAATSLVTAGLQTGVGRGLSLKGLDLLLVLHADPDRADKRIVMVEVDQASLDYFAKDNIPFPWPRSLYNPVLDFIAAGGATSVSFDILFDTDTVFGEEVDQSFAEAIKRSKNVMLATALYDTAKGDAPPLPERLTLPTTGSAPTAVAMGRAAPPLPRLVEAAARLGSVTAKPEADGVFRRYRPYVVLNDRVVPALGTPSLGKGPVGFDGETITLPDGRSMTAPDGSFLLNYHGTYSGALQAYRRYPVAQVISSYMQWQGGDAPAIPLADFADTLVIIGYAATGLFDLKPTPLAPVSPGSAIHAVAMDNLLNGDWLTPAPAWLAPTAGGLAAVAMAFLVMALGPTLAGLGLVATVAALATAVWLAFDGGFVIDGPTIIGAPLLAFAGTTLYRYGVEGARRRALQNAFGLYLSPAIVEKIAADPDGLKLGGEKRDLTLFFCDLAGFTTLSEQLSPEELVAVLNDYTTRVTDVILALDGTVDKYIGDAIMAFWGAPADQPDHAARGVEAALGALEALTALNRRLADDKLPLLSMRVGLNSGPAVVGNMGSTKRFNYTAMGDTVNEASRFEGLGKAYGTQTLAAEPTATDRLVAERFLLRKVDFLTVKGKDKPTWAYEILARVNEATDRHRQLKEGYEQAMAHYLARRWDEADAALDAILADGADGPSTTLKKRIAAFRATPPPDDWNGVFTHTSK